MLHIVAFINNTAIRRIDIHNLGITNRKGQFKYAVERVNDRLIEKPRCVWHKREDGWMRLTEKAIRAYLKDK